MSQSLIERQAITLAAGATSALIPHTLKDPNGPIAPNWIWPTTLTNIRPLTWTPAGVVYINEGPEDDSAVFSLRYDMTPQRSSAQGVPAGIEFVYRGAGIAGPLGSSFLELSGQGPDGIGNVVPNDRFVDLYVQSDLGVVFKVLAPTYGDDNNPGTKDLPFLTVQGAIRHVVRQGVQGVQVRIWLGGYSVRPPGGWPVTPAVNDPWDGYPDERRRYTQRDIRFTGMEAFRPSYAYHGPRKMFPSTPVLTYVSAVQVGQRVLLTFVENAFTPGSSEGTYIALRSLDDDRDIFFPHVISECPAPNQVYVEPPFSAAAWDAVFIAYNGYFRGMVVAVEIAGDWDYENSGVNIHGDGAGEIGAGRVGGGPLTINPEPHLSYLMIIRPRMIACGSVYCAHVWFDNGTEILNGCQPRLAGCSAGPNGYFTFEADGRALSDDSDKLTNLEVCGWALVPSLLPSPTADPVFQRGGGPGDLVVSGLAQFKIGKTLGSRGGRFRVVHGLSVITLDGRIPVQLFGADACLFVQGDAARPGFLVVHGAGAGACIWAVAGAQVYTYAPNMELVNGDGVLQRTMRVGFGPAINAGNGVGGFMEVLGWNGNFSRRLENLINPGFPDDDDSAIIDASRMPAGYAGIT